jgi:hypothetical protein
MPCKCKTKPAPTVFKPYVAPVYTYWTDFDPTDKRNIADAKYIVNPVECPQCKGHGRCILKRDAYGVGQHFKGHCMNCNGYGFVTDGSDDAKCCHEYDTEKNVGNCLHEWKCRKCGKTMVVDSSD